MFKKKDDEVVVRIRPVLSANAPTDEVVIKIDADKGDGKGWVNRDWLLAWHEEHNPLFFKGNKKRGAK